MKEMLLERVQGQTRLAILEEGRLCDIFYERKGHEKLAGNIYAGRVQNILPGMNAAFVDIGLNKNAFLYAGDIGVDTRGESELKKHLDGARIEKMLRPGQMIVAQVVKEPGGSKGPRISGSITLPGRVCVALPTLKYAGVSKKIVDTLERDRLFAQAQEIAERSQAGIIVRTAAEGLPVEEIALDHEKLMRQWERIHVTAQHEKSPRLIHSDGSLTQRAVRDLVDESLDEIQTDDADLYAELENSLNLFAPQMVDRLRLYKGETPLFDLKRVDRQLETAMARKIWLDSGGTLVIDETEAMTVIDVNTGKFTGDKSLGETVFRLNCEAAEEIARLIRLRDLGGIIIIDFIDMETDEQRTTLLQHLSTALKGDHNRTAVLGMTQLGLVEMTRKKERMPLSKQLMHECSACAGSGREPSYETVAYTIARELWRRRRSGDATSYCVTTGEKVAGWLNTIGFPEGGSVRVCIDEGVDGYHLEPDCAQTSIRG